MTALSVWQSSTVATTRSPMGLTRRKGISSIYLPADQVDEEVLIMYLPVVRSAMESRLTSRAKLRVLSVLQGVGAAGEFLADADATQDGGFLIEFSAPTGKTLEFVISPSGEWVYFSAVGNAGRRAGVVTEGGVDTLVSWLAAEIPELTDRTGLIVG